MACFVVKGCERVDSRKISLIGSGIALPAHQMSSAELDRQLGLHPGSTFRQTGVERRFLSTNWDQALLPRLVRLMQYGRLLLLRGGRALLDMTYVDNVVDAVLLSLQVPAAPQARVFNIGNGEPIAAADLFDRIAASFDLPVRPVHRPYWLADLVARMLELGARLASGWEPPVTRYSLGAIAFSQTLDLQSARAGLGYAPAIGLDEGIARTAAWWKERAA
jgi:nucleoside-diphosphate-sugar epimerase